MDAIVRPVAADWSSLSATAIVAAAEVAGAAVTQPAAAAALDGPASEHARTSTRSDQADVARIVSPFVRL